MLIYFTGNAETPALIARKFAGRDHPQLAKWIYRANLNTQAHRLIPGTNLYAPQRPIVIPETNQLSPQDKWFQERILHRVDWLSPPARWNLHRAQEMGMDINQLLFSHQMVQVANHHTQDASIGLTQGFQALDVANDLKAEHLSKFTEALEHVKGDLYGMATALDHSAKEDARVMFRQHLEVLNTEFHHEITEFELRGKVLLNKPFKALKLIKKHGWEIFDEDILHNAERAARALRFVGDIALAADGLGGIWETIQAYREGKDWVKVGTRESADILSLIGARMVIMYGLVALGFTPVGWVAFLVIGTTAAITSHYFDEYMLNPLIDEYV